MLTRERSRLVEMTPLFDRQQATPLVGSVLSLEEARLAHERLETGHGRGKIVLAVGMSPTEIPVREFLRRH
jgi:NADPH2:quinone reductase